MNELFSVAAHHPLGGAGRSQKAVVVDSSRQGKRALTDLIEGLSSWQLWGSLGWDDIRQRYARSVLGPFWLTLSMAILVFSLGFMYGTLFRMPAPEYLPYIGTGFVIWAFISTCITDGCGTFYLAAPTIKQISAPLSIYPYRVVWRTLIVFLHNITIYLAIIVFFGIWPGLGKLLLAALGLVILCLNGVWVGLFLGVISARFRDIPPIVASFVQVVFFLTPIFWRADQLPGRAAIVEYNPLLYYVEIVRQPLLGKVPPLSSWAIVLSLTVFGCLLSFATFTRYRRRLAYWV
jgi:homopolymeric O-antigen transport system permease protein